MDYKDTEFLKDCIRLHVQNLNYGMGNVFSYTIEKEFDTFNAKFFYKTLSGAKRLLLTTTFPLKGIWTEDLCLHVFYRELIQLAFCDKEEGKKKKGIKTLSEIKNLYKNVKV